MKYINLTQGKRAMVDDEDYEALNKYTWYAWKNEEGYFYAVRTPRKHEGFPDGTKLRMHRVVMSAPQGYKVDHKFHCTLDNRKSQLRLCDTSQNAGNQQLAKNSTSGYKGVSRLNHYWQARIGIKNKRVFLGNFKCKHDAADAYNEAALEYHKEFAYLNEVTR